MTINLNNYELYFINYFDKALSPEEIDELMAFLKVNPELEDEFFDFQNVNVILADEPVICNKDLLKKSISDKPFISAANIDEFLVADLENDLTSSDKKRLNSFLSQNPEFETNKALLKKTISNPDMSVVFPNINSLKKKVAAKEVRLRYFYYSAVAAAASLLLLFNIYFSEHAITNASGLRVASKDTFLEAGLTNSLFSLNNENTDDTAILNPSIENDLIPQRVSKPTLALDKMNSRNLEEISVPKSSIAFLEDQRLEYSSLYDYIQASEYKEVNQEDYADIVPAKNDDSFLEYAVKRLFTKESPKNEPEENAPKVNMWKIIDVGTYGINSLAKNDLINVTRTQQEDQVKTGLSLGGTPVFSTTSKK